MYITFYQPVKHTPIPASELSPDDFLRMLEGEHVEIPQEIPQEIVPRKKITVDVESSKLLDITIKNNIAGKFLNMARIDFEPGTDDQRYSTFQIPKKSDPTKMRSIQAPDEMLKAQQKAFAVFLETYCRCLCHEAAHAYVKGRGTTTALKLHQANESKWFIKIDLKDFFPSFTYESIMAGLNNIYPFGMLLPESTAYHNLENNIKGCLYKNHLPQGTPVSPMLTNILMMPFDNAIQTKFSNFNKKHFVYTRYADDILLSCKYDFNPSEVVRHIRQIFKAGHAPFTINNAKTRYGSSSGRNWNLGMMLNKDNRITIGHEKNQKMRAMIFQFIQANKEQVTTPLDEAQRVQGLLSYYKSIDPVYTNLVIERYERKFRTDLDDLMRRVLSQTL